MGGDRAAQAPAPAPAAKVPAAIPSHTIKLLDRIVHASREVAGWLSYNCFRLRPVRTRAPFLRLAGQPPEPVDFGGSLALVSGSGKMRFQSFFMLTMVQFFSFASDISESEKVPIFDSAPYANSRSASS